jgi:ABC-type glycerol-3-phosphate transport system substrate-binding protein
MKFKRVAPVVFTGMALMGVAACGGSDNKSDTTSTPTATASASTDEAAVQGASSVKVAFSAPAADHGWLKALSDNAKAKAKELGIDMKVSDSATTSAEQADQIETLIQDKPDVLVVLPNEGEPLTPVAGTLYELDAIAAVVIGGTSLMGGRATIVGTVLGVITFALVFNLLTLMNLAVEIQSVTKGGIILAAVLLQRRG